VYLNYDVAGNLTGRTDRLGRATSYQFDSLGRKTTMTDPRGGVTTYNYTATGELLSTIGPLGFGPSVHLDADKNVIVRTTLGAPVLRLTEYTYDANNHLTTTLNDNDGSTIHQTADFRGNVLATTDEVGNTMSYTYDQAGQLVQTTDADGTFTLQGYDRLGRVTSKTDERGNTTTYGYEAGCDCSDRMTSATDPLGRTTRTTYDAMGRRTSVTDAARHQTFYAYDLRGHLIETDYADGTTTRDTYDALGRRTASTDQTGATTHYGYDAEGQLISVTDPLNDLTQYAYDPSGNLTSVTDANNHTTAYAYDADNRKTGRALPLGMTETFSYDAENNTVGHTDFRGKTTTYNYDLRKPERLTSKVPDPSLNEPTVSYGYNLNNTRASMTDASGMTTYTYDGRNRLLTKAAPAGTLTYAYDASGNVASILSSNANGTSVSYAWDAANQLASVTDNRLSGMTTAAYTATGRPASLAQPNGVAASYAYDSLDRVTSLVWKSAASPIASWAYTYNGRGQRLTATDATGREAAYGYDPVSRLTSETVTGDPRGGIGDGALTYSLDPTGNRLSRTSTLAALASQAFEYDANDQLTSDSYDPNGNTTNTDGNTYAYDFENRVVSKNGGAVTIVYDGDGNRVAKTVDGVSTQYLVDDLNPTGYLQVLDEVSAGVTQMRYTYGNVLVSQAHGPDIPFTTNFYGYDVRGDIIFLADSTGTVTDNYTYDAWGSLVATAGPTSNRRFFEGEEFDPDLGLINLRARHYDSLRGRFLTADPLNSIASVTSATGTDVSGVSGTSDTMVPITSSYLRAILDVLSPHQIPPVRRNQQYLYAEADPINVWDPLGLEEEGVLVAGIGGAVVSDAVITVSEGVLSGGSLASLGNAILRDLTCFDALYECLERKGRWPLPDCSACFRECETSDGIWPTYKCPQ
jgi:RHS repeat-associated protein